MKSNKYTSGFSLVDLLIVTAILAILGAASYPAYIKLAQLSLLKSQIREIKSTLRYASEQSIMNNRLYAVVFDDREYFVSIEFDPLDHPGDLKKVEPEILNSLAQGVVFESVKMELSDQKNHLYFLTDGSCTKSTIVITTLNRQQFFGIELDSTGKITTWVKDQ